MFACASLRAQPYLYAAAEPLDPGPPPTLLVLDVATNEIVHTFPAGGDWVVMQPDGSEGYTGSLSGWNDSGVAVFADALTDTINLAPSSGGAVSPDGAVLYGILDSRVAVIDTATRAVIDFIDLGTGSRLYRAAMLPDGSRLLVLNRCPCSSDSPGLWVVDTDPSSATYHSALLHVDLPADADPVAIVVTPDSFRAYIAGSDRFEASAVFSVDLDTFTAATVTDAVEALGVAMNSAGTLVYVSDYQYIRVFDVDTAREVRRFSGSVSGPTTYADLSLGPDDAVLYAVIRGFNHTSGIDAFDTASGQYSSVGSFPVRINEITVR